MGQYNETNSSTTPTCFDQPRHTFTEWPWVSNRLGLWLDLKHCRIANVAQSAYKITLSKKQPKHQIGAMFAQLSILTLTYLSIACCWQWTSLLSVSRWEMAVQIRLFTQSNSSMFWLVWHKTPSNLPCIIYINIAVRVRWITSITYHWCTLAYPDTRKQYAW